MKFFSYYSMLFLVLALLSSLVRADFSHDEKVNLIQEWQREELLSETAPFFEEEGSEVEGAALPLEGNTTLPINFQEEDFSEEGGDQLDYVALGQASRTKTSSKNQWTTGEKVGLVFGALVEAVALYYGPKCYNHYLTIRNANQGRSSYGAGELDKEIELQRLRASSSEDIITRGINRSLIESENNPLLSNREIGQEPAVQYESFKDKGYQTFIGMSDFWELTNSGKIISSQRQSYPPQIANKNKVLNRNRSYTAIEDKN